MGRARAGAPSHGAVLDHSSMQFERRVASKRSPNLLVTGYAGLCQGTRETMKRNSRKRSRRDAFLAICVSSVSAALSAHAESSSPNSWTALHEPRSTAPTLHRSNDEHNHAHLSSTREKKNPVVIRRAKFNCIQPTDSSYNARHSICRLRGGEQSSQTSNSPGDENRPLAPPPPPPPPPPLPTTLTEVYENEIYSPEDQSWSAAGTAETTTVYTSSFARWTQPDGTPSPPPTTIAAPPGYEFADEWKIDVTGVGVSRDELGWEYSWDGNGLGRRRRRWLRKLKVRTVEVRDAAEILREQRIKEQDTPPRMGTNAETKESVDKAIAAAHSKKIKKEKAKERPSSTTTAVASRQASVRRSKVGGSYAGQFTRALLRPIRDNWNFKGYGISVMKSLIFPSAGGVSFRLPLSINFDWYERRPELPSITSSATYYYSNSCPWTYVLFLNASLPMELIRFCVRRFGEYTWFLAGILWSTMLVLSDALWRVLVLPATVLVRFASLLSDMALNDASVALSRSKKRNKNKKKKTKTKRKAKKGTVVILGQTFPRLPPPRSIVYSTVIQDRVGVSASWRLSATKGYEFRISYWHLFLPTMLSMASVVAKAVRLVLMLQENASKSVPMKGRVGGDLDSSADDHKFDHNILSVSRIEMWKRFAEPCEDWIQRKTGSLGLTWGGPIPEKPYLGASAVLSVSALYPPAEMSEDLRNAVSWISPRKFLAKNMQRGRKDEKGTPESHAKDMSNSEPEVFEIEEEDSTDDALPANPKQNPSGTDDDEENSKVLAGGTSDDDDLDSDNGRNEDAELPISTL